MFDTAESFKNYLTGDPIGVATAGTGMIWHDEPRRWDELAVKGDINSIGYGDSAGISINCEEFRRLMEKVGEDLDKKTPENEPERYRIRHR